jgi:AcrR family transcriptional regulator
MTDAGKIRALPSTGTTPNRREQRRLETRQKIYEAALAEFREAGFQKAQIDRIVERAGVARGTFYFHFPSKEHVLLELQQREEQAAADRIAEKLGGAESLSEYLHQVVDVIVDEERHSADEPELMREMLAMYVREPRAGFVQPMQEPLLVQMIDFFHECADRGELRDDLSPEELVGIFMRSLFGWVAIDVEGPERDRRTLNGFVDIFVKGASR